MPKIHLHPSFMGPKSLAGLLETAGFWRRLVSGGAINAAAAKKINELDGEKQDLLNRLAKQERFFKKEESRIKSEANREANSLFRRTKLAVEELETYKKNGREEVAVAVILSPSQYAELTSHGMFRASKIAKLAIYVARGVYGPVVLTQDGFNGFTRMAPELDIRAKVPSKGGDW